MSERLEHWSPRADAAFARELARRRTALLLHATVVNDRAHVTRAASRDIVARCVEDRIERQHRRSLR